MIKFEAGADYGPAFHSTLRAHFNSPGTELLISQWGLSFVIFPVSYRITFPANRDRWIPLLLLQHRKLSGAYRLFPTFNKVQGIFWQVALSFGFLNLEIYLLLWIFVIFMDMWKRSYSQNLFSTQIIFHCLLSITKA